MKINHFIQVLTILGFGHLSFGQITEVPISSKQIEKAVDIYLDSVIIKDLKYPGIIAMKINNVFVKWDPIFREEAEMSSNEMDIEAKMTLIDDWYVIEKNPPSFFSFYRGIPILFYTNLEWFYEAEYKTLKKLKNKIGHRLRDDFQSMSSPFPILEVKFNGDQFEISIQEGSLFLNH